MNFNQLKEKLKTKEDFNVKFSLSLPIKDEELKLRRYRYPYDNINLDVNLGRDIVIFRCTQEDYQEKIKDFLNKYSNCESFCFIMSSIQNPELYDLEGKNIHIGIDDIGYSDKIVLVGLTFE